MTALTEIMRHHGKSVLVGRGLNSAANLTLRVEGTANLSVEMN